MAVQDWVYVAFRLLGVTYFKIATIMLSTFTFEIGISARLCAVCCVGQII